MSRMSIRYIETTGPRDCRASFHSARNDESFNDVVYHHVIARRLRRRGNLLLARIWSQNKDYNVIPRSQALLGNEYPGALLRKIEGFDCDCGITIPIRVGIIDAEIPAFAGMTGAAQ